jgi:predicted nucleic acid-binding protein
MRHPRHARARRAFREASATVISPLVFAELEHVITRNMDRKAAHAVLDWLLEREQNMRVLVPELSADTVQMKYAVLRLDLADAVNFVLAEQYETDTVLTLDSRDFRAVRPLTGHSAFRLLPDDL